LKIRVIQQPSTILTFRFFSFSDNRPIMQSQPTRPFWPVTGPLPYHLPPSAITAAPLPGRSSATASRAPPGPAQLPSCYLPHRAALVPPLRFLSCAAPTSVLKPTDDLNSHHRPPPYSLPHPLISSPPFPTSIPHLVFASLCTEHLVIEVNTRRPEWPNGATPVSASPCPVFVSNVHEFPFME
jgi:hypothetical protein